MKQNELILDKHLTCRVPTCKFHILCQGADNYHIHFILNGIELIAHIQPFEEHDPAVKMFVQGKVGEERKEAIALILSSFFIKILNKNGDVISHGAYPMGKDIDYYSFSKHLKKHRKAILSAYTMVTPAENKIWA